MSNKFITNLKLSSSDQSDMCINEWKFSHYSKANPGDGIICICGKEIQNLYYIENTINNNLLMVGSNCIEKFMRNNINNINSVIKQIKKDLFYVKKYESEIFEGRTSTFYFLSSRPLFVNMIRNNDNISKNDKKFLKFCDSIDRLKNINVFVI